MRLSKSNMRKLAFSLMIASVVLQVMTINRLIVDGFSDELFFSSVMTLAVLAMGVVLLRRISK